MGKLSKKTLLTAFALAAVPVVCTFFYTSFQGNLLSNVFIPDSGWNDELFYYKLVESVLSYGYPRGYFGFNESQAQYLSFAAWSPVIILQWVLWGLVFGWNYLSPILSNLVAISLALFIFGLLTKPTLKQLGVLTIVLALFKPLPRYILSCVPETEIFASVVIILGLSIHILRERNCKHESFKLICLFIFSIFITLIRPYLLVLMVIPCYTWIVREKRRKKLKHWKLLPVVISIILMLLTVTVYLLIGRYLCAEYLEDLYYTDWIKLFLSGNIKGGVVFSLQRIKSSLAEILLHLKNFFAMNTYYAAGLYYFVYGVIMLFLFIHILWYGISQKILSKHSENRENAEDDAEIAVHIQALEIIIFIAGFLFGMADILMYRIEPGGRHTLIYTLAVIMLLPGISAYCNPFQNKPGLFRAVLGMIICVFFVSFILLGNIPYEYKCAYADENRKSEMNSLATDLYNRITLEDTLSFDNTVIWSIYSNYGEYYALPAGMGISCCMDDYVMTYYDELSSRYIGATPGSTMDEFLILKGAKYIAGNERIVFYQIR